MKSIFTILGCALAYMSTASGALRGHTTVGSNSVLIHAPTGPIVGFSSNGARVFRQIPYAEPPVDALRFQAPQPKATWTSPYNASIPLSQQVGCIQHCELPPHTCPPIQSEDCLFLNVFTPDTASSDPLPVILFIHGGDWRQGYGGGILYDGSTFAKNKNVVVVSINYR